MLFVICWKAVLKVVAGFPESRHSAIAAFVTVLAAWLWIQNLGAKQASRVLLT